MRKCASVEEAAKKLVETALQLGTMDNTTVIVIKLDWSLDFITPDEIEEKIQDPNTKKTKEDKETLSNPSPTTEPVSADSSPLSFRNNLENLPTTQNATSNQPQKHFYPTATAVDAIKLKVLIPHIEGTYV